VYRSVPFRPWDSCGDQPPCRGLVGFLWGSQKLMTRMAEPSRDSQYPNFQMLMISPQGNPELRTVYPPGGNSAPTADLARLRVVSAGMINPQADVSVLRTGIQSRRPTSSGRIPYLSAGP